MGGSLLDRIKIGGIYFAVKRDDSVYDRQHFGEINIAKSEILLATNLDEQSAKLTLLHEIIHAILIQAGMKFDEQDEKWIDVAAYGFLQVMHDNPGLLAK